MALWQAFCTYFLAMKIAGFTSSFAITIKCPSSKQNVVLLLSSMKLSCLHQEYLLVLGNLSVRKQCKNFLMYQTCMLVYILLGLATFLVLPQLSHEWHHISLYQWVVQSSTFILLRFAYASFIFWPFTFMFFWIHFLVSLSLGECNLWEILDLGKFSFSRNELKTLMATDSSLST